MHIINKDNNGMAVTFFKCLEQSLNCDAVNRMIESKNGDAVRGSHDAVKHITAAETIPESRIALFIMSFFKMSKIA